MIAHFGEVGVNELVMHEFCKQINVSNYYGKKVIIIRLRFDAWYN